MKKFKFKKKINIISLLQLIIKIIALCIETFRQEELDEEIDENDGLTDEKIADYVFNLVTYTSLLGDLCRQECESDTAFSKRYTEKVEEFMKLQKNSAPIVNPDGTPIETEQP